MQLAAWEFWASGSPLPIVLFPQICYCLRVGCPGIYEMLVEVFCELQRGIHIYGLVTIIIGLKKQ